MSDFEQLVARRSRPGLLTDFWHLLRTDQKWWLLPLLAVMAVFGAMILLSGTAAAPFIYTLF